MHISLIIISSSSHLHTEIQTFFLLLGIDLDLPFLNSADDDDVFSNRQDEGTTRRTTRTHTHSLRRHNTWFEATSTNTSADTPSNSSTTPRISYAFDYVVTFDHGLTYLSDNMRSLHGFQVINVTLHISDACFGSDTAQHLIPLGGIDTVIQNYVMYTTRQAGYMFTQTGDLYRWSALDYAPYTSVSTFIHYKLSILCLSLLAYAFISTITALLVRVLISSGMYVYVCMWGIVYVCMSAYCGCMMCMESDHT
ncbi:hypothetical protein EON65_22540 [archaeon]|nr:MAG: hypothetical protein EON65_22540 [archaeon]